MKNIKTKLSIASCTLLGGTQQVMAIENAWDLDTSLLTYSEADNRVDVTKAMVFLTGDITTDDTVNVNLVLDTMSGSTPTGAVRSSSSSVSSFTGASGASTNINGSTSVDLVNFSDTRLGIALNWSHALNRLSSISYGGSLSVEKDYQSYGASINYSTDSEDRLTTYNIGFASSFDEIYRKTDGTPEPLSNVELNNIYSNGERYTYDTIFGISRVLNRKTVGQFNYTISYSDGYHTDPYKVISQVRLVQDSTSGEFAWTELDRFFEGRPNTRLRHTLFSSLAHQYGETGQTVHTSYRYYTDDWGITSHTFDLTHRTPLIRTFYMEPHFRYYYQNAADFFMHSILDNGVDPVVLPEYASSDYRLDETVGLTLGVELGVKIAGGRFRARLEFVDWQHDQAEYNETRAMVVQVSYQKIFD